MSCLAKELYGVLFARSPSTRRPFVFFVFFVVKKPAPQELPGTARAAGNGKTQEE